MDDVTVNDVLNNQSMFKQLTYDRGYTVGERKGGDNFLVSTKKVIMTSNESPKKLLDEIQGFERRFDIIRIHNNRCSKNPRKRQLFCD